MLFESYVGCCNKVVALGKKKVSRVHFLGADRCAEPAEATGKGNVRIGALLKEQGEVFWVAIPL